MKVEPEHGSVGFGVGFHLVDFVLVLPCLVAVDVLEMLIGPGGPAFIDRHPNANVPFGDSLFVFLGGAVVGWGGEVGA